MLLAVVLLRQGQDVATVAARTHVPAALLELVRDELNLEVEQPRHPRTLQRARRRRSPQSRQSIAAVVVVLARRSRTSSRVASRSSGTAPPSGC